MELTPQQDGFIEACESSDDSIVMNACAGSGKTTTLVAGINAFTRGSVAACAFNKINADTLAERMPEATCKTMNAYGHGAWKRQVGRNPKLEKSKMFSIADDARIKSQFTEFDVRLAGRQLATKAKHFGIVPEGCTGYDASRGLVDDDPWNWQDLADSFDIETNGDGEPESSKVIECARQILTMSIDWAWGGIIDFDDQIYMTACFRAPLDKYDLVAVDEAQDISGIQQEMIRRMTRGRVIAVGDRQQAIYAFRGASATSMDDFITNYNAVEMPLSVSFRCPKAVVREAREIYTHIEEFSGAIEGSVNSLEKWDVEDLEPGSVIICRNNAPIISLAFKMLRQGVGCNVVGRDIGKNMQNLVKKHGKGIEHAGDLLIALRNEMQKQVLNALKRQRKDRAEALEDKFEAVMSVVEGCESTQEVLDVLEKMFAQRGGLYTLSTVHRAKGLEWPHVYFLDRHIIPAKFAHSEAQMEQEMNLAYVGVTRAQRELTYIETER